MMNLFSDKTPFTVMFGTESGDVEMLTEGYKRTFPKIVSSGIVKEIDYLYSNSDIFFRVEETSIYRFYFTKKISTIVQGDI